LFELDSYEATPEQRRAIRILTSQLIGRYIKSIKLNVPATETEPCLVVEPNEEDEIRILKQITFEYVINNPNLAAQQRGHKRILEELFADLNESGSEKYVPRKHLYLFEDNGLARSRAVADCIASLTESEALQLHGRLRGYSSGSVLDPIVR
jgi:dGTPase